MVLQEWAQVWNLYKECSLWRLSTKLLLSKANEPVYWGMRFTYAGLLIFYFWLVVSSLLGGVSNSPAGMSNPARWVLPVFCFAFWGAVFIRKKALEKKFAVEYEKHRIADHPHTKNFLYLRYALFLRGLVEQQYSSEKVGKLASFAEIASPPEPVFKLFTHPVVTFVVGGLLSPMLISFMSAPNSWEALWPLLLVRMLVFLLLGLSIVRIPKQERAEIKRFLEWAKLDIKEEKSDIAPQPTLLRGTA